MEMSALTSLRAFDRGEAEVEETLAAVLRYNAALVEQRPFEDCEDSKTMVQLAERYRATLNEKPWTQCSCAICQTASIEVIIFRGSNRNKRRGIHNLSVFKDHIDRLDLKRAIA